MNCKTIILNQLFAPVWHHYFLPQFLIIPEAGRDFENSGVQQCVSASKWCIGVGAMPLFPTTRHQMHVESRREKIQYRWVNNDYGPTMPQSDFILFFQNPRAQIKTQTIGNIHKIKHGHETKFQLLDHHQSQDMYKEREPLDAIF